MAAGRALDVTLGRATLRWLDATKTWEGLHTPAGATPAKVAASHALARALAAVTRDGKEWAAWATVAQRLDPDRALRVVRRGQDVARETAAQQWPRAYEIVQSGLLFVAPSRAPATVEKLHARRHHRLLPAGADENGPMRQLQALRFGLR